jgi:hypothetical protein
LTGGLFTSYLEGEFSEVRNLRDALFPSEHPCRFESSAIRIRSRADAKLPELRLCALLAGDAEAREEGHMVNGPYTRS